MKVKIPDIPQPPPLPPMPQLPPPPPAPNIISPAGNVVVTRDPVTGQETYRSTVAPEDAARSQARKAAQDRLLAEIQEPPEAEVARIESLRSTLFKGAERRIGEDAETARQRLLEELNARGLLGSTGTQGETGLRGELEKRRQESLREAGERSDLLAENLRATRRGERSNLYNLLGSGISEETARATALTPLEIQASQVQRANQLSSFQYGPLAQYEAEARDRAARSAIEQANAQQALQAQMAQVQSYGSMASAAGMVAALKLKSG